MNEIKSGNSTEVSEPGFKMEGGTGAFSVTNDVSTFERGREGVVEERSVFPSVDDNPGNSGDRP